MILPGFTKKTLKTREFIRAILFFYILAFLAFSPAWASNGDISINPTGLTILSDSGVIETRSFLIMNNNPDAEITDLQITTLDLVRLDNVYVIPESSIKPDIPSKTITARGFEKIAVTFDFNNIHCGEYSGNLLISSNSTQMMLPVLVKLKFWWLIPFLVLITSTFASVWLYDYATSGQKSDKLRIKITSIENKILVEFKNEPLTDHFKAKIANPLSSAKEKMQQGSYEEAESDYSNAETVWNHWYLDRDQWTDRLSESKQIIEKLKEIQKKHLNQEIIFIAIIERDLEDIWEVAAEETSKPEDIRSKIRDLKNRVDQFSAIDTDLDNIFDQIGLQGLEKPCIANIKQDLFAGTFTSGDVSQNVIENYKKRKEDCLKDRDDIKQSNFLIFVGKKDGTIKTYGGRKLQGQPDEILGEVEHPSPSLPGEIDNRISKWKLSSYRKIHVIFLPAILLALIGFSQLYIANATFGANLAYDFSSLILWAFGTGPASDALVQLVQTKTKK